LPTTLVGLEGRVMAEIQVIAIGFGKPEPEVVFRTETISVKVCAECGAEYRTPGTIAMHHRVTGHTGTKTRKETRERTPSRVTYQPGYGPTTEGEGNG
jgi:hypothetical protein